MPYYRGDGNYYRGDPFLGALVGGLVGKAAKWAVGRIGGGAAKRRVSNLPGIGAVTGSLIPTIPSIPTPFGTINPGNIFPGGEPFITPSGKRYRRMNPLNPKALRRALRRAEGFEKFARRTVNALYKTSPGGGKKKRFKKAIPSK